MNRFLEYWYRANEVISKVPYTEKSHQEVIRLQKLAYQELEEMLKNPQLTRLEVPAIA